MFAFSRHLSFVKNKLGALAMDETIDERAVRVANEITKQTIFHWAIKKKVDILIKFNLFVIYSPSGAGQWSLTELWYDALH